MPVTKIKCDDCECMFDHYTTVRVAQKGKKKRFCEVCIEEHKRTAARNYSRKKVLVG